VCIQQEDTVHNVQKHKSETHRKSPDDFLVNEPGPLGTASDTVTTSNPTLNDLQQYSVANGLTTLHRTLNERATLPLNW